MSELAAREDSPLDGFGLFGTVKETGVDDEGLSDFYTDAFTAPLYQDEGLVFYNDFYGAAKLKLNTWNPFKLYKAYKEMTARLEKKGLEGNLVGEGLILGGIVVFDKDGRPRYAYREETGKDIPVDDLLAAVNAVKAEKGVKTEL